MSLRHSGLTKSLVLVGFMASGKSTVGALLAEQLHAQFVDTDDQVEAACGMTVSKIFETRGEPFFRKAERETVLRCVNQPQVVALGGGAFIDPLTRAELRTSAHTIWLDPPFDLIRTRLALSSERPIANVKTGEQLHKLWIERRAFYAQADLRIENAHDDPRLTVQEILQRLPDF